MLAAWVCVGLGLLTAWVFPPAYVFFSVGTVLSVVAIATHQVRDGLLLLAGSLARIGFSALLFLCGVAALFAHAVTKLPDIKALPTPDPTVFRASTPPPVVRAPVSVVGPVVAAPTPRPVPLTLAEVSAMISAGRGDEEIVAAVYGRPPLGRLGVSETTTLRAYGASERLLEVLRARFAPPDSPPGYQTPAPATLPPTPRSPLPARTTQGSATAPLPSAPVDYAARDRQVADLKRRAEVIDETIRRTRADPHYYGIIKNSTNTSRQQASDAYLADLDRQREDLRRQKWALEGR